MRSSIFLVIVFLVTLWACDTTSNIKDPSKNYFVKYFGGNGSQRAVGLIVNTDGTFFILGNSRAADDSLQKIYLAKAKATGEVIWQKTFNENVETEARGFVLTGDQSNLAVVANRYPSTSTSYVSLYFFDVNSGAKTNVVSIPSSSYTYSNSITLTNSNEYLLSGNTPKPSAGNDTSVWVYLVDPSTLALDSRWTSGSVYNTSGIHFGSGVKTFDGGDGFFYMYGSSRAAFQGKAGIKYYSYQVGTNGVPNNASDNYPPFYLKGYYNLLTDVFLANPGAVITGVTDSLGTLYFKLLKMRTIALTYDLSGSDLGSEFSLGGSGANNSYSLPLGKIPGTSSANPFVTGATSSTGYHFVANSFSVSNNSDIMLLKTNLTLTPQPGFPVTFGGVGDDTAAAVAELPDGHIIVLGTFQLGNPVNQYKIVLMKLNSKGQLQE